MVEYWKSFEGKPFDPQRSIHDAVGKIITSLVNKKNVFLKKSLVHVSQLLYKMYNFQKHI